MDIEKKLNEYYEQFKGIPSYAPIVRNNQKNDAFELVIFDILYSRELDFSIIKDNVDEISKYIIAPPDGGIDIFYEKASGDDYTFDVIQVKTGQLNGKELKSAILDMKRTIDDYCSDPNTISSKSCLDILSASNLDKSTKNNCEYYVVHTGDVTSFVGAKDDEHVLTLKQLEILANNISDKVDSDIFTVDRSNNMVTYDVSVNDYKAIICSINGYDLAVLNNKYYNTELGRNILFGQNLREQLNSKKSKTYKAMENTINNCPENFWFYNNGITIIADGLKEIEPDEKGVSKIQLIDFSIVNGAQTTSSLGLYLKEANSKGDKKAIENLKKVFVLTRILQVSDEDMQRDIAIYNNTQNPITSRDMVANREEQKKLNAWLLDDDYPQIYVEIRRGAKIPGNFNKAIAHRITTNEELAQIAYAAFFEAPFTAKDKKSALFNMDFNQTEYTLNKTYHDIFYYDEAHPEKNGIIFKKSKIEIDEALFVEYLYKQCRGHLRKVYQSRIEDQKTQREGAIAESNESAVAKCDSRITEYSSYLEIVGVCMFYFESLYYEFKAQFPHKHIRFDYDKFYSDKKFKKELVKDASNLFLTLTIRLLKSTAQEAGKGGNINNWVRGRACQEKFFQALGEELSTNMELEEKYDDFIERYTIAIE